MSVLYSEAGVFQSTPPVRGATWVSVLYSEAGVFQSTPPVRGATHFQRKHRYRPVISIHAPRAGGDEWEALIHEWIHNISIHAPRAGGDL